MKPVLSSRKHHHLRRVGIILIMAALVAWTMSCMPAPTYELTVTSTEGGSVTTPVEGTHIYDSVTELNLVATPDSGYRFVRWTGDVGTVVDVDAASTSITIDNIYSVTANFVPGDAVPIWDWHDLNAIRDNPSGHYVVMNDIDNTTDGWWDLGGHDANQGKGWQPVAHFSGTLDGRGHAIGALTIRRPEEDSVGLFGTVDAVIKNIGLVKVVVNGRNAVGGLAGVNLSGGTVTNCYCTGGVTGENGIGGLVGHNSGAMSNSYSEASVFGNIDNTGGFGGLVGRNLPGGTVRDCYFSGNVGGDSMVGGLVGWNEGTVSNSHSSGSVRGEDRVGGLVGYGVDGTVSNSFWDVGRSGIAASDGGTGKTTEEMKEIATFSGAGWSIIAVADPSTRNASYTWNVVDGQTYPFLSWEPVA